MNKWKYLFLLLLSISIISLIGAFKCGQQSGFNKAQIDWDEPPEWVVLPDKETGKSQGQLEDEGRAEFERFLDAIEWVESKGDANAIGENGEIGAYQLTKAYVDDIDSIFQQKYGMSVFDYSDRYDKEKSRTMVILYFQHYGRYIVPEPTSWEPYARIHNGGPNGWKKDCTKPYWEKVKTRMQYYTLSGAPE